MCARARARVCVCVVTGVVLVCVHVLVYVCTCVHVRAMIAKLVFQGGRVHIHLTKDHTLQKACDLDSDLHVIADEIDGM